MRLFAAVVIASTLALSPTPARAVSLNVGLGAGGWLEHGGVFDLTLGAYTPVASHIAVGGRFGAGFFTPSTLGIPLDLLLRAEVSRFYIEGVVGPWILFTDRPIRAHAGAGFGLRTSVLSVGIELAWLDPNGMVNLRIRIPI